MELELAQVSLERDSMSQQLLAAIRQKMALSQELEGWQVGPDSGGREGSPQDS